MLFTHLLKTKRHNHYDIYEREKFRYDEARDIFICPEGKELNYWGIHKYSRQHVYRASKKDCEICSKKHECTKDRARSISFHIYEESINKAKQLSRTKEYRISQRMRKRIEELFGEAKEFMGLRRAKFRRMKFVREQVLMTATAQNIKRMVKLLSRLRPVRGVCNVMTLNHFHQDVQSCLSRIFTLLLEKPKVAAYMKISTIKNLVFQQAVET